MNNYYHFTEYKYLDSIGTEGLIPQIGTRSISATDDRSAVYLSKGEISTILMYFALLGYYNNYKGQGGDEVLEEYEIFNELYNKTKENILKRNEDPAKNRMFIRYEKSHQRLSEIKSQVKTIRSYPTFEDYWGSGVYLRVTNVNAVDTDPHNSYTLDNIPIDQIDIVLLENKNTHELVDSKYDIIHYFMASTPLSALEDEYNDTIALDKTEDESQKDIETIITYYENHKEEFYKLINEYELKSIPLSEYLETKKGITL